MAHRRARQSTEQWKDIIADFQRSGSGANVYCREHDLAPATFHKWRRQFSRANSASLAPAKPAAFTEVHPASKPPTGVASITLELGPQITLSIRYEP